MPSNKRRALLNLYGAVGMHEYMIKEKLNRFLTMLEWIHDVPSRKSRTPMDVDELVTQWVELIHGLATGHDKDTLDAWEARLNERLEPFLKAPVKQIREFCVKLIAALKADQRIPFYCIRAVEAYIKLFVKEAKDTKVIELKRDLAMRIAKSVEEDVAPSLVEAMANALMWREPEHLERVEEAVKKTHAQGKKAKIAGRESCLFLEVEDECIQI